MSSLPNPATQVVEVARELLDLMSLKKGNLENAALYPAVVGSPRVQAMAAQLKVPLDTTHETQLVLRAILKALKRREKEVEELHDEEKPEEPHDKGKPPLAKDRPLARPMMTLLGLTDLSAGKGLTSRRSIAAPQRHCSMGSMRGQQNVMAREFAAHLLTNDLPAGSRSTGSRNTDEISQSLLGTVRQADQRDDTLRALSQAEVRQLTAELMASYREFYKKLTYVHKLVSLFDQQAAESELLESLQALADSGGTDPTILWPISDHIDRDEEPNSRSRFRWLACVLRSLFFYLPRFSRREEALLAHASAEANGNLHVFLNTIERSDPGIKLLARWIESSQPRKGERRPAISTSYYFWIGGLGAAEMLLHPTPIDDVTQRNISQYVYRSATFGENRWKWILGSRAAGWSPDSNDDWWRIEDSTDRESLEACDHVSDVDREEIWRTLDRLSIKLERPSRS